MNQESEFKFLRNHAPFKRIFRGWTVTYQKPSTYTAQIAICPQNKQAILFAWPDENPPDDFLYHELLHLALRIVYDYPKTGMGDGRYELEEYIVRHICEQVRKGRFSP